MIVVLIYFSINALMQPLKPNKRLVRTRRLAWECYGELMADNLLFKGEEKDLEIDLESRIDPSLQYKQIVNSAKHLLNIVQTSREGIKVADGVEFSEVLIKKILPISFSAVVVILRPYFTKLADNTNE